MPQDRSGRRDFFRSAGFGFTGGLFGSGALNARVEADDRLRITGESACFSPREFGAAGDGEADDTAAIQLAIDAAGAANGGLVLLPPGVYRTTAALEVHSHHVALSGVGAASIVQAEGDFDTLRFVGPAPSQIYRNRVSDLYFNERGKTGGYTFAGDHVAQFIAERVYGDGGFNAWFFHNFNYVTLNDCRFDSYRGMCFGRATGGGRDGGRSDILRLHGLSHGGSRHPGTIGIDIDGFVHTVSGEGVYLVNIGAQGLWARNTIGADNNPSFFTFDDLECDYPDGECIRLEVGEHFYFNNTQIHATRGPAPNVLIGERVTGVSFTGGFSTGSQQAGIQIDGRNVALSAMHFHANSSAEFGGATNSFPGILIGSTARDVIITGCCAGREAVRDYQSCGCQIEESADGFVITGNDFRYNVTPGIHNSAGTGPTKVIANNI